jgi:RNA polymerase sigma-70 factor, ECF subfamily
MESVARMTEKLTESDLLARCGRGDRAAMHALFVENQNHVFSVALAFFGGDRAAAEDVTQQVFLKIFKKLEGFRADAEFTTWLYRVTVNACLDERRKRRKFFSLENFFGDFRTGKTQEAKFERREISDQVQKAIAELKPKFRLPILLKYTEGLSYEEIAQVLNCSTGTIASRLNRGHKMLAQKLKHLKNEI